MTSPSVAAVAPCPNCGAGVATAPPAARIICSAARHANAAERDDHPHVGTDQPPLGVQPRRARRAFGRCRRIAWRRTAHRRGHPSVVERQPIRGVDAQRLVGQAGAVQRREQEVAGAVAGEHPAGPVAAVRGGRQPDDHHPRPRRAPTRNRPAPVRLVGERLALDDRDLFAPLDQPRAGAAHRHLGVELRRRFSTAAAIARPAPASSATAVPRTWPDRRASRSPEAPASRTARRCADGPASHAPLCLRGKIACRAAPAAVRFGRDTP